MSDAMYVQCTLQRATDTADPPTLATTVAWLPARYGTIGKVVRLQTDPLGEAQPLDWLVVDVTGRATGKDLERRARAAKNQRKASDI